jgi:hypothetical protein
MAQPWDRSLLGSASPQYLRSPLGSALGPRPAGLRKLAEAAQGFGRLLRGHPVNVQLDGTNQIRLRTRVSRSSERFGTGRCNRPLLIRQDLPQHIDFAMSSGLAIATTAPFRVSSSGLVRITLDRISKAFLDPITTKFFMASLSPWSAIFSTQSSLLPVPDVTPASAVVAVGSGSTKAVRNVYYLEKGMGLMALTGGDLL